LGPAVQARVRPPTRGAGRASAFTREREPPRRPACAVPQAEHRGLADALEHYPPAAELRAQLREPAIEIVTPLVERAHRTGELRRDVDALDLLVVLRMLAGVAAAPELSRDRVRRHVDLVLRGLRPD
jgi:hypothetical protein